MTATEVIWIVLLNAGAWLVIQMGFAWIGTRLPVALFQSSGGYFRSWKFERAGKFYENIFRIGAWKDLLPDGAKLFEGGFPKSKMARSNSEYLRRFVAETRRGEAVHVAVIMSSALFFLWNPPKIAVWMIVYALVSNLPCVLAQRYNRIRMVRVLDKRDARKNRSIDA
jgi:glycosyl-4,4'-diaponeurosporenoate acyltransferase